MARVGIKTWVSNAIVYQDLEHFIGAHSYSLLQSLSDTLLWACPQTDVGSGGSPAPFESSLPPLEDAYPPPSSSQASSPEVLLWIGLTTSSRGQSTSHVQRSHPSNPYVALRFNLQRMLRKKMNQNLDIFEQVFRSVVIEYWDGREHDVLGYQACFNVGGYCRKSCYNVLHPFHRCPPALDCSCNKL